MGPVALPFARTPLCLCALSAALAAGALVPALDPTASRPLGALEHSCCWHTRGVSVGSLGVPRPGLGGPQRCVFTRCSPGIGPAHAPLPSVPGISELGGGPSAGRKGGGAGASRELPAHNGQPGRLPEEGGGAGHPSLLVAVWQNPGGGSVLAPPGFDHLPERGRLAPEEVTRSAPAHPPGPAQAGSWDPIKQSTLAPHGGVASYVPGCPCQAAQDAWLGSRACGTLAGAGEGSVSSPLHLRLGTLTPFFGTAQGGSQDSVSCSALPTPATRGRVAGPLCVLFPSLGWAVRWAGPALA